MTEKPQLKRSLNFWLIFTYGLGTILGAGVYVLVGAVAGRAGMLAPLSFFLAAFIALFSGISYARLASRFPQSAGEAVYVNKAFNKRWLSGITGWLVVVTGVVSSATLVNGFVGYLDVFISAPDWLTMIILVGAMATLAAWGVTESVSVAMLITLIEVVGLIAVIIIGAPTLSQPPPIEMGSVGGVFSGAFLAFYAFIGFEDIVNMAEEVKNPRRTLPLAIYCALGVATLLYVLVALVAVVSVPLEQLGGSEAPMALFFETHGINPIWISLVSLIAVINGALVQIVMASRVLYGMTEQKNAPRLFGRVHPKRQTPMIATLLVALVVLILALWFPLVALAETTSFVILIVFSLVNLSLLVLEKKGRIVPLIGLGTCATILVFRIVYSLV